MADPLLEAVFKDIELNARIKLKKKARIFLDKSAILLGVIDDQGVLGPNEVFV